MATRGKGSEWESKPQSPRLQTDTMPLRHECLDQGVLRKIFRNIQNQRTGTRTRASGFYEDTSKLLNTVFTLQTKDQFFYKINLKQQSI